MAGNYFNKIKVLDYKHIVTVFILVVIAISFITLGGIDYLKENKANPVVAEVGKDLIYLQDFNETLNTRKNLLIAQFGSALEGGFLYTKEFKNLVLQDLVITSLIRQELESQFGIVITRDLVKQSIKIDPMFLENGKFQPRIYQNFLALNGITEDQFYKEKQAEIERKLLLNSVLKEYTYSNKFVDFLYNLDNQVRNVDLISISFKNQPKIEITDKEIQEYYKFNQQNFLKPEERTVYYFDISRFVEVNKDVNADSDEIARIYNQEIIQDPSRITKNIYNLVFDSKEDAEKALTLIKKEGKSLPDVAAKMLKKSESDIRFDGVKQNYTIPALSDTIFKLKEREISDVIKTDIGYHIIQVIKTNVRPAPSLQEKRGEISKKIKHQKLCEISSSLAAKLNETLSQTNDINTAVEKVLGVKNIENITLSKPNKTTINQNTFEKIFNPKAYESYFEIFEEKDCDFKVFQIASINPSTPIPLVEIKDRIKQIIYNEKYINQLTEKANQFYNKLQRDKKYSNQADPDLNISVKSDIGVGRQSKMYSPDLVKEIFQLEMYGFSRPYITPDNKALIANLRSVDKNSPIPKDLKNTLSKTISKQSQSSSYEAFIKYLYARYNVRLDLKNI